MGHRDNEVAHAAPCIFFKWPGAIRWIALTSGLFVCGAKRLCLSV